MGFLFSKIFNKLFGAKDFRILILGLDNAGKTTILCNNPFFLFIQLFLRQIAPQRCRSNNPKYGKFPMKTTQITIPLAIGFNVETVVYKNLKFQVWDLGGQTGIRYT